VGAHHHYDHFSKGKQLPYNVTSVVKLVFQQVLFTINEHRRQLGLQKSEENICVKMCIVLSWSISFNFCLMHKKFPPEPSPTCKVLNDTWLIFSKSNFRFITSIGFPFSGPFFTASLPTKRTERDVNIKSLRAA
jgi:hypothetical protein